MLSFLGVVLLAVGIALVYSAFKRPEMSVEPPPPPGPNRANLWSGVICLVLGGGFALWPQLALARMEAVPLSRQDDWRSNPPMSADGPIRWENGALTAELEAGSGRYAAFPVDWDANRFEAKWDMTVTQLDLPGQPIELTLDGKKGMHPRSPQDSASIAIGLMDQNVANIDDRDHVNGSGVEACFTDDIRLRASDSNYIVRTASADEAGKLEVDPKFKKQERSPIAIGTKYHCTLGYDQRTRAATLTVSDGAGKQVERRLEDLKDLTNSVAYFGVSVRGYNRFDKKLDPKKKDTGYTRPKAVVRIENMEYRQP